MALKREQCRAARGLLGWSVRDLAEHARISPNTVSNFETGGGIHLATAEKIEEAFGRAGVELIAENSGGIGVRFRKRARPKRPVRRPPADLR